MRRPRTVPCGTPDLTVVVLDDSSSTLILPFDIVWLARKRSIEEEALVYHRILICLIVFCEGLYQKP